MKLSKFIAVIASGLLAFTVQKAEAVYINGAVTFFGTADLDTTSAGTATTVENWFGLGGVGSPFVATADGNFALAAGTLVNFAEPWTFNSGPVDDFWVAGAYTFDLTSSSILTQTLNPGTVTVIGTGFVSAAGFDSTFMTWRFSTQDPSAGAVFSFSASGNATGVPDGGSILALLGVTLVGIEGLRRKLAV